MSVGRASRVLFAACAVWSAAYVAGRFPDAVTSVHGQTSPVTFARDVLPILYGSCATCHRPTGSAPFSLLTYDDAKSRAAQIVAATASRFMPPWKPEPGHGEFLGNRRLTDQQIATIRTWVDQGAVEGDPASMPPLPRATGRWQLGEPDLVLQTGPYTLRATGDDMYRNFVLPLPISGTRYVRAWEFLPGNPRVVHHATMQFDTAGSSREMDARDSEPGYEGLIAHSVHSPDGFFLDWGPGHMPYVAPDGMAWPLRPGTDLVMMLHLRPSGRPEPLQGTLGLYFADRPPTRTPTLVRLTKQHLDIAPGESAYRVTDAFTLNVDVDVYTVQPHAHYLARNVRGYATLPDGTELPLISIRDWDFDWQGVYRYASPVALPAGTILNMEYVYDNSASNPRNPHTPPRRVTYGQRTTDEMAELWFQVVPRSLADRTRLVTAARAKMLREEIVGHEKMLEADPKNAALHDGAALLLAQVGNLEGSAAHFAESLHVHPESPAAHYNLGMALLLQGKRDEAGPYFEKALALGPDHALAHDGLGVVRQAQGRLEEALDHYRKAAALAPGNVEARYHLAATLRALGRLKEALPHYEQVLRMDAARSDVRAELADLRRLLASRP